MEGDGGKAQKLRTYPKSKTKSVLINDYENIIAYWKDAKKARCR